MKVYSENSRSAIIVLHEIYGINSFIEDTCAEYRQKGFDVYCPYLLGRTFSYYEKEMAYEFFYSNSGLDKYTEIIQFAEQLIAKYAKLFSSASA